MSHALEVLVDEYGSTGILQYPPKADTNDRRTPRWFFEQCARRFGPFHFDVACTADNALADRLFDQDDNLVLDALSAPWTWPWDDGSQATCWCNPPYGPAGTIPKWIAKARKERDEHGTRTLLLLPADTSTEWYQDVKKTEWIEDVEFRLAFEAPDGSTKGNSAKFGSVLVYIAPKITRHRAIKAQQETQHGR